MMVKYTFFGYNFEHMSALDSFTVLERQLLLQLGDRLRRAILGHNWCGCRLLRLSLRRLHFCQPYGGGLPRTVGENEVNGAGCDNHTGDKCDDCLHSLLTIKRDAPRNGFVQWSNGSISSRVPHRTHGDYSRNRTRAHGRRDGYRFPPPHP